MTPEKRHTIRQIIAQYMDLPKITERELWELIKAHEPEGGDHRVYRACIKLLVMMELGR